MSTALIVEDHLQYAELFAQHLRDSGYEVTHVADPLAAKDLLRPGAFKVAVVDMLFGSAIDAFDRREGDRNPLTRGALIVSGLSVAKAASDAGTNVVMWTSAEPNRRLHLVFAYQDLGVRVFCSKTSPDGLAGLGTAVLAAAGSEESIDHTLGIHLPDRDAPSIARALLRNPPLRRAIWSALAAGARDYQELEALIGNPEKYLKKVALEMYASLDTIDASLRLRRPNPGDGKQKLIELAAFASRNREFFLDEAVCEMYP